MDAAYIKIIDKADSYKLKLTDFQDFFDWGVNHEDLGWVCQFNGGYKPFMEASRCEIKSNFASRPKVTEEFRSLFFTPEGTEEPIDWDYNEMIYALTQMFYLRAQYGLENLIVNDEMRLPDLSHCPRDIAERAEDFYSAIRENSSASLEWMNVEPFIEKVPEWLTLYNHYTSRLRM